MFRTILLVAALLAPSLACAQISSPGAASPFIARGTTNPRSAPDRAADTLNIKDFGAGIGDGLAYADATLTTGSNALTSPQAAFGPADIGKLIFVSGSGVAGAPQSGTITGITSAHIATLSFSASTSVGPTTFVYGTDGTAAFAAMLNAVNVAGNTKVGYMPGGVYLVKLGSVPVLSQGGVRGDGPGRTLVYLDPTTSGDLFAWSEAWGGVTAGGDICGTCGDMPTISTNRSHPSLVGVSIRGSLTAPGVQNAITLYNRDDDMQLSGVVVQNLHGRCFSAGQTLSGATQAYLRESPDMALRCEWTGTASLPAVEISSTSTSGSDATNEIGFRSLHIFGAAGVGLLIHNPTAYSATRQIHIGYLRIERSGANQLQIGAASDLGTTASVAIDDYESINNASGTFGLLIAKTAAAIQPYNIAINSSYWFAPNGGSHIDLESGSGVRIVAGDVASAGGGVAVTASSSSVVSGAVIQDGGAVSGWSVAIAPAVQSAITFSRGSSALSLDGGKTPGRFYLPVTYTTPISAAVGTASRLYAVPIFIGGTSTLKTLSFNITTANASAWNARLCVYADAGGAPGALLADGGNTAVAATVTGVQTATLSPAVTLVGPRWYWAAFNADSAAESVSSVPGSFSGAAGFLTSALLGSTSVAGMFSGTGTAGYDSPTTFGACPGTFPTLYLATGVNVPILAMGF